jgi:hypothetical protein
MKPPPGVDPMVFLDGEMEYLSALGRLVAERLTPMVTGDP